MFGEGGGGAPSGCQGLQCQWQPCAPQGKPETSLTGTVYDPAGALPLYNVYVYVLNAKPDPITPGHPTCTQCEAPASGNPVIGTSTDANGRFTLQYATGDKWGVPSGSNIPLVLQVGKWRRQLTIPSVTACAQTDLDAMLGKDKLRLPKMSSEGDMPLIAFTSGCDPAECFLRHIGIDDSEFVPPGSSTGHVHFYTAQDNQSALLGGGNGNASAVAGGNTYSQTYQWWTSAGNLLAYDIVFNACECNPNDRGAGAYGAVHDYLDGGGRVFTTHYYYNWFAAPTGPSDFQSVASWTPGAAASYTSYFIDTSFPKGQAFGNWLVGNGVATQSGGGVEIALTDTRTDVNASGPPSFAGSTRWIYNADTPGSASYSSAYLSFNTPVGTPTAQQCGRAVFSDVHLSGTSNDATFPGECASPDPSYAINEKALEFLFFDLSSCVQNDTQPPVPPTNQ